MLPTDVGMWKNTPHKLQFISLILFDILHFDKNIIFILTNNISKMFSKNKTVNIFTCTFHSKDLPYDYR